jgi:threonine dehydrogenase-like Zn-dependent dehydrogenase
MRAAVFKQVGQPWVIESVADPTPLAGEAVIEVGRCGICGSDLGMTSGEGHVIPGDTILGHEYSGEVVALGAGPTSLRIGDVITALPATGCGHCAECRGGEPVLCRDMHPYMGGFAQYMRVPQATAVCLPDGLSMADGALVEPLAVGLHGVRRAALTPGARVLVLGVGAVGLATIFWARRLGAGTIVAASRSARRAQLSTTLGADSFVATGADVVGRATDALRGPADVVFECGGIPGMLGQAIEFVRPNGCVVSLGACMKRESIVAGIGTLKQASLLFSMAYSLAEFRFVVDFLGRGHLDARHMISNTIALDALPGMIERLRGDANETKVQVDPRLSAAAHSSRES